MAREWQQTRMKEYVLPDAVYYQSLWAVRDYERMCYRLHQLEDEPALYGGGLIREIESGYHVGRPVENQAMEAAILKERIEAINNALLIVPPRYRSYIISNIVLKNQGNAFPNKTWRFWKQKFLYQVARNLCIL